MPKPKWKGWLKPVDVEPKLLTRILEYNGRYEHYLAQLGSNEHWEAHNRARIDVPLTEAEFCTKQRLLTPPEHQQTNNNADRSD